MRLLLTNNRYYTTDLNCLVHVYAAREERLLLYFKTMDISNDCANTWLELHDGYSLKDHYVPGMANTKSHSPTVIFMLLDIYICSCIDVLK